MKWMQKLYKNFMSHYTHSDWDKVKAGKMTKAEYTRRHGQVQYDWNCQYDDYESMLEYSEIAKSFYYTGKGMTRAEFLAKWGLKALEDWDDAWDWKG